MASLHFCGLYKFWVTSNRFAFLTSSSSVELWFLSYAKNILFNGIKWQFEKEKAREKKPKHENVHPSSWRRKLVAQISIKTDLFLLNKKSEWNEHTEKSRWTEKGIKNIESQNFHFCLTFSPFRDFYLWKVKLQFSCSVSAKSWQNGTMSVSMEHLTPSPTSILASLQKQARNINSVC